MGRWQMQKQRACANSAAAGEGVSVRVCLVGVREAGKDRPYGLLDGDRLLR